MKLAARSGRLGAVLALAACAAPAGPEPEPALSGPGLPLALAMTGEPARVLLENVATRCWLDNVVGGDSLVIDRQAGRLVISSGTADLLVAQLVPAGDGMSIVRLTGPAAQRPATALVLSETLERAATTGQTTCGPATA